MNLAYFKKLSIYEDFRLKLILVKIGQFLQFSFIVFPVSFYSVNECVCSFVDKF